MAGLPVIGPAYEKFMVKYKKGKEKQGIAVRVLMEAVVKGVPQGCVLGAVSYNLQNMMSNKEAIASMTPDQRRTMEQAKSMQPKSVPAAMGAFAALFSVQYGLAEAMRHYRKERDIWTTVLPAAGGGAAFALAQNQVNQVIPIALGFAGFTFIFEKLGWGHSGEEGDTAKVNKEAQFMQSKAMLTELGFQKYHGNIKNGLMTDETIMLWTDGALADCKIPPGPRLLILYHLSQVSKKHSRPVASLPSPPVK